MVFINKNYKISRKPRTKYHSLVYSCDKIKISLCLKLCSLLKTLVSLIKIFQSHIKYKLLNGKYHESIFSLSIFLLIILKSMQI